MMIERRNMKLEAPGLSFGKPGSLLYYLFYVLCNLLVILCCAGCRGGGNDVEGPRDTLVFSSSADATILDPHNTTDSQSDQVI